MVGTLRVLNIDLDRESAAVTERGDLGIQLGGSGLAVKLFEESVRFGEDFSNPLQPIVFAIGPMTSIYPVVTKVVAMFVSPLTGGFGESHAGMRLGLAMRFAGYDAIVIKGKAKRPVYLVINSHGVKIKPAGPLWGMTTEETGRILRDAENCAGHRSCMRIGPAGEKLVRYAGVNVDTYRHFGRMGLGAVFGAKQLKAVVVQGDSFTFPIPNFKSYSKVYREIYNMVTDTSIMDKYHGLGTAGNVLALNELGALPTRNLQANRFSGAEAISGESFAEHKLIRKLACTGCPVGCIHLALYRTSFGEGQEYEYAQLAYDHELVYALGSLLGLSAPQDVLALIQAVELEGLDAISTGVTLAWATEAMEKGILTQSALGCRLEFGNVTGYLYAIRELVEQNTEAYRVLALGAEAAAEKYGGRDFALTLGGNEVAGYHTGIANIIGQAVGARHSHLDNAGYSLDQEKEQLRYDKLAEKLILEESERNVLTSLCICLFARKVYTFELVERALSAIGIEYSQAQMNELGRNIFLAKRRIKESFGFAQDKIKIPRRFYETPSLNGMLQQHQAERLMEAYLQKLDALRPSP